MVKLHEACDNEMIKVAWEKYAAWQITDIE